MAEHARVLEALSLDPPAVRPGEVVTVHFAAPNVGSAPTTPGEVVFEADALLAPLGETRIAIGAVAPGERVVASAAFRLGATEGDVAPLAIGALLTLGDASYRAAPAWLVVRTAPILDGAASGTFVALRDDGETIDVRAVVANEGDGAARDVRLTVPPPAGCVRVDGDEEAACARLEPGGQLEVAFVARLIAPAAEIAAHDALVTADGIAALVPVRTWERSVPRLAAPRIEVDAGRRRSTIAVTMRNDGWADASDLAVRIVVPRGIRVRADGIAVDGVAIVSRAPRRGDGSAAVVASIDGTVISLTIAATPARTTMRIELDATHPAACAEGTIRVESAAATAEARFVPPIARDVRLRLVQAPAPAAAGQTTDVEAVVCNAGDVAERLTLRIDGAAAAESAVELAPGYAARRRFTLAVTDRASHDAVALIAFDEEGERARIPIALTPRVSMPDAALRPTSDDERETGRPRLAVRLDAPDAVDPGCMFELACIVDTTCAVAALQLSSPPQPGVRVVPGSTRVDGHVVREAGAASPLERGIDLRGLPAGARIIVRWSLVADPAVDTLLPQVVAIADEAPLTICAPEIAVRRAAAFPTIDDRLPFRLASHALEAAVETVPPSAPEPVVPTPVERACSAIRLSFDAHGEAPELAARLVRGDPPDALAGYLPVLGALFPTACSVAGADTDLTTARTAIADGFDRLHVLLRLPGFTPAPDDLEDAAQRRALVALYRALEEGAASDDAPADDAFTVELDTAQLAGIVGAFADARFGSPSALRAIVALIPRRCDDEPLLAAALERYLTALDDALRRCDRLGADGAERALATGRDTALEDARRGLAAALRARTLAGERR